MTTCNFSHELFYSDCSINNECDTGENENHALRLLDLHPGMVKFADLAKKMEPVTIKGLEHITGVMGTIEHKDSQWMSCNILDNDDEDDFQDLKEKSNIEGPPVLGAILWAHYATFIEGDCQPLGTSKVENNSSRPAVFILSEITIKFYYTNAFYFRN